MLKFYLKLKEKIINNKILLKKLIKTSAYKAKASVYKAKARVLKN